MSETTSKIERRCEVVEAIEKERSYQDRKWGTIEEHPHTVGEWILIMEEFVRKARLAWVTGVGDRTALFRILQISSLGVACMEQHGVVERNQ